MANEIKPIRLVTVDTDLRRVIDQINVAFKDLQIGNSETNQYITNLITYVDAPIVPPVTPPPVTPPPVVADIYQKMMINQYGDVMSSGNTLEVMLSGN